MQPSSQIPIRPAMQARLWQRLYRLLLASLLLLPVAPAAARAIEVPYRVEITGVKDDELLSILRAVSRLVADADRPPPTLTALRRRAESDLPLLEEALASLGYYGATVDYGIDTTASPVRVTLAIEPGEPYRIAGFKITGENPALADGRIRLTPEALELQKGDIAEAKRVVAAEARLLAQLANQAYPLARVLDRKVIVDHAAKSMTVDWQVDTGPKARFGAVTIEGLDSVKEVFVRARLPWQAGEPFDARKIERGRRALVDTRLFASIRIANADAVDAQGRLPVTVSLAEAKHRSIGGGVRYSTSEGVTGRGFWEHRNLLGAGELLRLTLLAGQRIQGATVDLRKPGLTNPRLGWIGAGQATRENFEAYRAITIGGSGGLEYQLTDRLRASGGLSLEWLDIDEGVTHNQYFLLGAPLGLIHDTTTDPLDPASGHRLRLGATPYVSVGEAGDNFVVLSLAESAYLPLRTENRVVLAGWGRVGSIAGASSTQAVPATKRLYGGGANSVRAYGFQELGPIGADGDPTGGRSQIEGGLELRWRMFENWGGAVFFEGGSVYDDPVPNFDERFLIGAGFGLRYITAFGPIRADIAFPINPRDNDDAFQFYIGLGQAF